MSQKTNPLSLRLQKNNRNFASPWFCDFFFRESYHHQLEIEEYLNKLLKQAHYSKALLSVKNSYRRLNVFFLLQDFRADRKEKQLSFNIRQKVFTPRRSSSNFLQEIYYKKAKSPILSKIQKQIFEGYTKNFSLIYRKNLIKNKIETKSEIKILELPKIKNLLEFKEKKRFSIAKKNLLQLEDDKNQVKMQIESYLLSLLPLKAIDFKERNEITKNNLLSLRQFFSPPGHFRIPEGEIEKVAFCAKGGFEEKKRGIANKKCVDKKVLSKKSSKSDFYFSFKKKVRDTFLKSKQNYTLVHPFFSLNYFDFFLKKAQNLSNTSITQVHNFSRKKDSFYKNERNLKKLWQSYFFEKVTKNNCLSFCEKVTKEFSFSCLSKNIKFIAHDFCESNLFGSKINPPVDRKFYPKVVSFSTYLLFSEEERRGIKIETNLHNLASLFPVNLYFEPIRFISDTQNASALLDTIVALLEKRVSFRQIKSRLFQDLSKNKEIKGVRLSCSGRLGGRSKKAQKAKTQSDQWGEISLNAFSSKVLFEMKSAHTLYGKVGMKIWLSFEKEKV